MKVVGYRFSTGDLELRIEHDRCRAIAVVLDPQGFVVTCGTGSWRYGLCDPEGAARQILALVVTTRRGLVPMLPALYVVGRLIEVRERGLPQVNPTAASVVTAVLAMVRTAPRLAGCAALYSEPFVVRDVLQYRAAAAALGLLEDRLWGPFARATGSGAAGPSAGAPEHDPVLPDDTDLVAAMARWRDLYSPDGRAYRSLNRTLMNLPAGIRGDLLCNLNQVFLERPVTGRLALAALLVHVGDRRCERHPEAAAAQRRILQHASDAQIAAACRRIGALMERELRPTRLRDLGTMLRYLLDCPDPYRGDLPGLVERAIRWHRRLAEAPHGQGRRPPPPPPPPLRDPPPRDDRSQRTARPPIPLPDQPEIRFLATANEVVAEGERMGHCIADYARDAIDGECFLFHVSYQGEEASVEVDGDGRVGQACGPRNVRNRATTWGAGQLRAWGRRLRAERARSHAAVTARLEEERLARLAQTDLWPVRGAEPDDIA